LFLPLGKNSRGMSPTGDREDFLGDEPRYQLLNSKCKAQPCELDSPSRREEGRGMGLYIQHTKEKTFPTDWRRQMPTGSLRFSTEATGKP
jgi:hypothetical protein